MESFSINLILNNTIQEFLVIPEDCNTQSVFHLVKNDSELCKLIYTDNSSWELLEDADINKDIVKEMGKKIEEYYL